jgi:hypothetical protein
MIKAIMGLKGTGKTKALADLCNQAVAADHGNVVYIEKGKTLMFTINSRARLVNIEDYEISDFDAFYGFVAGLMAGNHDITEIFIDSITKICAPDLDAVEVFLNKVKKLSDVYNVNVTVTVTGDVAAASAGLKNYLG